MIDRTARWAPLALGSALLLGSGLTAATADNPALTRDAGLEFLAPADGARVGDNFLLAWAADSHQDGTFAVLVDTASPPPRDLLVPGPHVIVVRGTALRLTLGPRHGGSPSARRSHTLTVIPVDANGYRIGESSAVLHVRTRS